MSFFNEVFDEICEVDDTKSLKLSYVENKGIIAVGKIKILTLNEDLIVLKNQKNLVTIEGESLMIKTVSKGEIAILGKVFSISFGDKR